MQIFQLALLCATMALDASLSAAVDLDHEHEDSSLPPQASSVGGQAEASTARSSSPSASSTSSSTFSLGDLAGFVEATLSLQRSRSVSPRFFGARGGERKEAASTKADAVSAPPAAEDLKVHRRQRKSRAPGAKASASGSSSPASTVSSSSSTEDTLGFKTCHHRHPRCFGRKPPRGRASNSKSTGPRSPTRKHGEAKGGGGVGSYLREISRLLRRGGAGAPSSSSTTTGIAGTTSVGQPGGRRGIGNAIASDEEMRDFVIASARNVQRNGPPVVPLG